MPSRFEACLVSLIMAVIKADARVPYARLVEVIDAVQKSGVEGLTLLTAQQDLADQGNLVTPKGLEMRVVN